ncbi:MAG TPA: ABC transporter ATP-binding protein [Candidatus Saccharimonadales bacterium]|nr:ABC transporter ATP-binding protein [Candidatus Saccharimonadales bacterium]
MDDIAIQVEAVSKTFKLPHEKNSSIKSAVVNFYKRNKGFELQEALKDVSFEVKKGEFFGIVGRNGSGKSTLLKLLAGIYTPSAGTVQVNGKLTPFIELGVGFNPELTGRENVFLNGALLGFSRKEMTAMYKDIVAFAEIEKFMDQKLKNYSSGMQVRLAFSIAIRAQSDILVLDEVLAVGDEAFQKKCIDVFESYKSNKQTVVLVTHDMGTVKRFCNRAMLLDNGKLITQGDPSKVATAYTQLNNEAISKSMAEQAILRSENHLVKAQIDGNVFRYGDAIKLSIDWSRCKEMPKNIGVAVYGNAGEYVFGANTLLDKVTLKNKKRIDYTLDALLGPGNYHFKIGVFGNTDKDIIEFVDNGPNFTIQKEPSLKWEGITALKHTWNLK